MRKHANGQNGTDLSFKNRIFQAAQILFVEKGYYNTSIPDIIKEAGVSTGALYHHYPGKEDLAREIHKTAVEQFEQKYDLEVRSKDSTYEKLRGYIGMMFRWTEEDPVMVRYLLHGRPKEILDKPLSVCSEEGLKACMEITDQGIQRSNIRAMTPVLANAIISGTIMRMIDLRIDGIIEYPLVEFIEATANNIWQAIKA